MLAALLVLTALVSHHSFAELPSVKSIECRLVSERIASAAPSDFIAAISALPLVVTENDLPHDKVWGDRSVPSSLVRIIQDWNTEVSSSSLIPDSPFHHLEESLQLYDPLAWRRENTCRHLQQIFKSFKRKKSASAQKERAELDLAYSQLLTQTIKERTDRFFRPNQNFKNAELVELVLLNALSASSLGWIDLWAVSQAGELTDLPTLDEIKSLIIRWISRSQKFLEGMKGLRNSGLLVPYFGERSRHELNFVATLPILTVESASTIGFADGRVHTPLEKALHDLFDHAHPIWSAFSETPIELSLTRYFSLMSTYQKAMAGAGARQQEWIADLVFLIHERPTSFRSLSTPSEILEDLGETALQSIYYRSQVQGDYTHSFATEPTDLRVSEIKKAISQLKKSAH